jgi:hypothetical protein
MAGGLRSDGRRSAVPRFIPICPVVGIRRGLDPLLFGPMATALLNERQHRRAQNLYLRDGRSASDCAAIISAEFSSDGLKTITPRMFTEYCSSRNWGARRKSLAAKGELRAHELVASIATAVAKRETVSVLQHQEFLEKSARIGGAVLEKAARLIETTNSPRDLASAANAARAGISVYRQAVGIDDSGSGGSPQGGVTNNFWGGFPSGPGFARGPDSPFSKPPVETVTVVPLKAPYSVSAAQIEDPPRPEEISTILISSSVG